MKLSVLIFGVSGFVGNYLAEEFYLNNYKVYGSDLFKGERMQDYVSFTASDIRDPNEIAAIIKDICPTYIVNLAAVSSVAQSWDIPQKTLEINVIGTLNILEGIRQHSPDTRLLLVGSSEEYAPLNTPINENDLINGASPYAISKATQEKIGEIYYGRYGINVFYVRAFNHTGIGQKDNFVIPSWCRQVAAIKKRGSDFNVITVGNLHVKRDFSDVRDIARGYRLVLERGTPNQVYNIGSGKVYELKELLNYIISLSDMPIEVRIDNHLIRPNEPASIWCDNHLIKKELGWCEKHSIFDAMHDMYEHYLNEL